MHREQITRRLTDLAAERGGHIGYRDFLADIGLSEQWLRGQPWYSGWNNLLAELGLQTRRFGPPDRDAESSVAAVAALVIRQQRWLTEDEFRRERLKSDSIPSVPYIRKLRRSGELARLIEPHVRAHPEIEALRLLASEKPPADEEDSSASSKDRIQGYVYLLRSGRNYKIGKSIDPSRRFREVRLELPEETIQVHSIATDDPTGIENYWHRRFATKRIRNTEFFLLNADDVRAFKLRREFQ